MTPSVKWPNFAGIVAIGVRVSRDTVAKFIWLPVEPTIQAHVAELHMFSSSQGNEFSNSIH